MQVLTSFPWNETTVDVIMVEVKTNLEANGCLKIVGGAGAYLHNKGFQYDA